MNSIWLSLLWKEWCEFRWKLVALTGILVATPFILVTILHGESTTEIYAYALLELTTSTLYVYGVLAGLFVGMAVAGRENARQTANFSRSLPMVQWRAALVKILVAMFVVAIPVILLVALTWLVLYLQPPAAFDFALRKNILEFRSPWGMENVLLGRMLGGVLGALSVLLWIVAGGLNRTDEVRAGAIGFLVCAAVWMFFAGMMSTGAEYEIPLLGQAGYLLLPALPGGPGIVNSFIVQSVEYWGMTWIALIFTGLAGHIAVLMWVLMRYGRVPAQAKSSHTAEGQRWFSRFAGSTPLQTQIGAVIWKQVREIGPLALFAAVGILGIVSIIYWWDRARSGLNDFGEMLGATTLAVSVLIAFALGVGVLYEDYAKGIEGFWRSRPINLNLWFALKYLTGFIILLATFGPLHFLANMLGDWRMISAEEAVPYGLVLLLIYSLALASYAFVHQPFYAVALAVALVCVGWLALILLYPSGPPQWLDTYPGVIPAMLVPTVLATLLAWQAVVRDWGWKQYR